MSIEAFMLNRQRHENAERSIRGFLDSNVDLICGVEKPVLENIILTQSVFWERFYCPRSKNNILYIQKAIESDCLSLDEKIYMFCISMVCIRDACIDISSDDIYNASEFLLKWSEGLDLNAIESSEERNLFRSAVIFLKENLV